MSFIDAQRPGHGVEPICALLPIAPSTYYEHKARQADPNRLPPRMKRYAVLRLEIFGVWDENFGVHGARKVWRQLIRERIEVARCTLERLMRAMGLTGAVRGKKFKTTTGDDEASRPADLVKRNFTASRPNELWISDLTYVSTWRGFAVIATSCSDSWSFRGPVVSFGQGCQAASKLLLHIFSLAKGKLSRKVCIDVLPWHLLPW